MRGWVKDYRIDETHWLHPLCEGRAFTKYEAWKDLIKQVNHKDNKHMFGNQLTITIRGEKITSLRGLGERWKWSKNKVNDFLKLLQRDEMITFETIPGKRTLIKIVNYEKWQGKDDIEGHEEDENKDSKKDAERTQKGHGRDSQGTQKDRNKNVKNVKEDIKDNVVNDIVTYLNQKSGKKFSTTTKETAKHINGRLSEGRTFDDFQYVIDVKTVEWLNDKKMNKYLRPETLFSPTNFESYLNQSMPEKPHEVNEDAFFKRMEALDREENGDL